MVADPHICVSVDCRPLERGRPSHTSEFVDRLARPIRSTGDWWLVCPRSVGAPALLADGASSLDPAGSSRMESAAVELSGWARSRQRGWSLFLDRSLLYSLGKGQCVAGR